LHRCGKSYEKDQTYEKETKQTHQEETGREGREEEEDAGKKAQAARPGDPLQP